MEKVKPHFCERGGGGVGWGTPLYKPYRCAAPSGMVFAPFWSEHGYTLCPFGLESGMVFERTTECINVFIVSIPNE